MVAYLISRVRLSTCQYLTCCNLVAASMTVEIARQRLKAVEVGELTFEGHVTQITKMQSIECKLPVQTHVQFTASLLPASRDLRMSTRRRQSP